MATWLSLLSCSWCSSMRSSTTLSRSSPQKHSELNCHDEKRISISFPSISFPRSKPCVEEEDGLRPPDSRLLPPAPTRIKPRPSQQGNLAAHIVTEFALNVRPLCSSNRERRISLSHSISLSQLLRCCTCL